MIRQLHGDAVLWVGEDPIGALAINHSMVRAGYYIDPSQPALGDVVSDAKERLPTLVARVDELPFQTRTLDGVVLHHALERVADPRTALREVARVLAPGGRLLICGFNPWSAYGLRRLYAKIFPDALSDNRFVNPLRLFDWLTLLGFELELAPFYTGFRLPTARGRSMLEVQEKTLRRFSQVNMLRPPFGGLLFVTAVKRAGVMRSQWRSNVNGAKEARRLAPVAYPQIANWQKVQDDR